jgi:hypothetical protein
LTIPFRTIASSFAFAFALALKAHANLVTNGTFTSVTGDAATTGLSPLFGEFGTGTGSNLTVTGWTTTGYNFVYTPGTIDSGTQASGANSGQPNQAPGQYNAPNGYGNTYMWGANNSGTTAIPNSPAGGNIVASDGDTSLHGAITQTIAGLTAGKIYSLTFYWAAAQQQGFNGATTESWTVKLGNAASQTTTTFNLASHSFSGWMQQTFTFSPTAGTNQTLSFLANGTPNGLPPFLLLAGVDLEVVPEFSNWMVFAGFGMTCIIFETARRRRHSKDTQIA